MIDFAKKSKQRMVLSMYNSILQFIEKVTKIEKLAMKILTGKGKNLLTKNPLYSIILANHRCTFV